MLEPTGKTEMQIFKDLHVVKEVAYDSGIWIFRAYGLAGRAMHTRLEEKGYKDESPIWLDWPDILSTPEVARVLILVHHLADKDSAPFDRKMVRTKKVLDSIAVYNDLMIEGQREYTKEEVEQMLTVPHLPRPKVALIDADRKDFDDFFRQQGFKQGGRYAGAYEVPWDKLVELTKEGHLPLY